MGLAKPVSYVGKNPHDVYKDFHWGMSTCRVVKPRDHRLPPNLIEIGLLMELHVSPIGGGKPYILEIPEADLKKAENHVAFDMDHPYQRIYLVLSPSTEKDARDLFDPKAPAYDLKAIAKAAGGRHGGRGQVYRDIKVQPLGRLTNTVYYTEKKGDGKSGYIHRMGEEGGTAPILCVAQNGTLWFAGGSYTCPAPGITN